MSNGALRWEKSAKTRSIVCALRFVGSTGFVKFATVAMPCLGTRGDGSVGNELMTPLFRCRRYGLVNKRNAGEIMDKCVLGMKVMRNNWRGNMSNPGEKAEQQSSDGVGPEAKAKSEAVETAAQSSPETGPKANERARRESFDGSRGEGA